MEENHVIKERNLAICKLYLYIITNIEWETLLCISAEIRYFPIRQTPKAKCKNKILYRKK